MGGGLLHFLNLNHGGRRQKKPTKLKRYTDGIEAPKNTIKFLPETSSSCQAKNPPAGSTQMKTLIAEEMTHKSNPNIHSAPSVIARLMGIDSLPSKPNPGTPIPTKSNQASSCSRRKPRSREHPQEEILQKFKKEFEAWQACKTCEEKEKSPHGVHKKEEVINLKLLTNARTNQTTLHREQCQLSPSESISSGTTSSALSTRIVLLKPSCENTTTDTDEKWIGGLSSFGRTADTQMNMEDFLEKVTEKLRMEVQGRSSRNISYMNDQEMVIGPREIAQNIARQVRERFDSNDDIGRTSLIRSESSGFYSSDSLDFSHRDAQNHATEKLISGLRNELGGNENSNEVRSRSSASTFVEGGQESDNIASSSPRSLVRSLSAPISGMGFRENLLLGHDRRKHKEVRSDKKSMKDGFDFKGRVSNLKHNLNINIKGNFFGKKVHASERKSKLDEAVVSETKSSSVMEDLSIIPNERLENSTEVPPSPASVSSTCLDELSKPSHPSPVSPLDAPFIEEHHSSQNPNESLPQILDEIILCDIIPVTHDVNLYEDESTNVDYDEEEAYVRDILIISGLYEWEESGSYGLLRLETLPQPLSRWVFEEVEEAFINEYNKENGSDDNDESFVDRKILFDLVNEALPNVLKPFVNGIGLCRSSLTTTMPHGNKLFEDVWNEIQSLTHVMEEEEPEYYLESLVASDVGKAPWPLMVGGETSRVGTEVEVFILDRLVEEFVLELYYDL